MIFVTYGANKIREGQTAHILNWAGVFLFFFFLRSGEPFTATVRIKVSALALVSSFAYGNALRKRYAGIPKLSFNTESLITREQELLSCWRMCEFGALYLDHIVSFLLQLGRIHAV